MTGFTVPTYFTAVDKFSAPMARMERSARAFGNRMNEISQKAANVSRKAAIGAGVIAAPLVLATKNAVEFEDKLADVGKTTGMEGAKLKAFGAELVEMSKSTRTGTEDLLKIAEIGGQLGINPNELNGFVDAINKFNVALGKDFAGGIEEAASQVGKIQKLFSQTRGLSAPETIMRAGSAINELGAVGAGTSANITDFTLRMGALPDVLKPSITNTLALGTFLEELGLNAEIGSGGMTRFLLVAGEQINAFAAQMKMSAVDAKALLSQDPLEFTKKFAASLNGLKPDVLAKKLDTLKIGTQETIKVLGAMAGSTERLTELQGISSAAFEKQTSLAEEYAKKEATTAAAVDKLKNQIKAFSIEAGNVLIPILTDILAQVSPLITSFSKWAKENPELVKTIIKISVAIAAFLAIVSVVAAIVSAVTAAMALYATAVSIATAAQLIFNASNPIGWLMIAGTLIALVVAGFYDWGAALTLLVGVAALFFSPVTAALALVVSLVMSFGRNWDMIVKAFKSDGILGGIKAIGVTLLDAVLYPVEQLLNMLSKIPGLNITGGWAEDIKRLRASMGVQGISLSTDNLMASGGGVLKPEFNTQNDITTPAINPEKVKQDSFTQRMETTKNQNVNIDINDKTGSASVWSDNNVVPINLKQSFGLR